MRFQHIARAGTALVALVAAALIATPSLARHRHVSRNFHRDWTHQERAQTRALNYRQARDWGLTANGKTGIQARRENIVARLRYRQELGGYRIAQQQFANEMGLYRVRLGYYYLHRRQPEEWWRAQYEAARPAAFSDALVGAEVDEPDGHVVGQIVDVHRYPAAHIARVEVALAHDGVAWIDSATLRYDATDRVAFTDVAAENIREASFPESDIPSR